MYVEQCSKIREVRDLAREHWNRNRREFGCNHFRVVGDSICGQFLDGVNSGGEVLESTGKESSGCVEFIHLGTDRARIDSLSPRLRSTI
ncbi:unnamed protein product [Nippostrongylus brasiliensis]|uniref:LRAT domain-containing protein n=1 Tax=Nippostrongylus brasiliensis TaxID=27835 RepID=A0A0N4YJU0_NIPBR|nr:unnamed protein product [Nippostrongylus brasiliensis]